MTTRCQAPARIPDELYAELEEKLETAEAEEVAIDVMMLMAKYDHPCGKLAIAYVQHTGHHLPVCQFHLEQHRTLIQPLLNSEPN
jgi:hypothetical protein